MGLNLTSNSDIHLDLNPIDIMGVVTCVNCSVGMNLVEFNMPQAYDHAVLVHEPRGHSIADEDKESIKAHARGYKTRMLKKKAELAAA